MAQAQKARKLEIELPAINAESMDKAVQDIYIRKYHCFFIIYDLYLYCKSFILCSFISKK